MSLKVRELRRAFASPVGPVPAVAGVSLTVAPGELVTLLGPSGCGKTTILRILAGFELPDSGEVLLDGQPILGLPPNLRPTAMVFQNYALFPHLSVFENIAYGLKLRRLPAVEIKARAKKVMAVTRLGELGDRSPSQLSGGQQQRVALARALVIEPKLLLLDEPLSNLDAALRHEMRSEIRRIQRELKLTSVYVTHDQEEAMSISDRIVILKDGAVQQEGTAEEIYGRPRNRFVAEFMGRANFLEGSVVRAAEGAEVSCLGRTFQAPGQFDFRPGEKVWVMVRPESLELREPGQGLVDGVVTAAVYLGLRVNYRIEVSGQSLEAFVSNPVGSRAKAAGEQVGLEFQNAAIHLVHRE